MKIDIGFEQLVQAIRQLPASKIMQLKAELAEKKDAGNSTAEFQELLLSGPIMDDKQYENYKDIRNRINKWRTK
ncbi:MAG: hypothetical protein ACHQHN_16715 [Sphingobacteriales bacterium]